LTAGFFSRSIKPTSHHPTDKTGKIFSSRQNHVKFGHLVLIFDAYAYIFRQKCFASQFDLAPYMPMDLYGSVNWALG